MELQISLAYQTVILRISPTPEDSKRGLRVQAPQKEVRVSVVDESDFAISPPLSRTRDGLHPKFNIESHFCTGFAYPLDVGVD
jgi:hypothetical protein